MSGQLAADPWMLKCATSAADFNRRLLRNRPTSFLDLHTNIEQVSQATQPSRFRVQVKGDMTTNICFVEKEVALNLVKTNQKLEANEGLKSVKLEQEWVTVGDSAPSRYPLALMRGQQQNSTSLYCFANLGIPIDSPRSTLGTLRTLRPIFHMDCRDICWALFHSSHFGNNVQCVWDHLLYSKYNVVITLRF